MRSIIAAAAWVCVCVWGCGDSNDGGSGGHAGGSAAGDSAAADGGAPAEAGAAGLGTPGASGEAPEAGAAGAEAVIPAIIIHPADRDGKVAVTGPTQFSAELIEATGTITWSLSGAGHLSAKEGAEVLFTPPTGTATQILTASGGGLSASVEITSSPSVLSAAIIPVLAAPATVQYDAQDIPHIHCAGQADCLAVQGYVQARDRFFSMDFMRHSARATLAELIGPSGLEQDAGLRTLLITRAGHRIEDDLVGSMDAQTKELLIAYVGGINAYLSELRVHPDQLPGEYAELPYKVGASDIVDWTLQDTTALIRLQQFQLSEDIEEESGFAQMAVAYGPGAPLEDLGKLGAWIHAAAPLNERAHTLAPTSLAKILGSGALPATTTPVRSDLAKWAAPLLRARGRSLAIREALRPLGSAVGSNSWVVSGPKSSTKTALVANDPHLTMWYPPFFHLVAMTSAKRSDHLDLVGGTVPGLPGALVGRGAHVGWGVTVAGYDVTDLYLEQFLPQASCPTAAPCVLFNAQPTPVLVVPQTYKVRVGAGSAGLVDVTTLGLTSPPPAAVWIAPQHGPMVQAPDENGLSVSVRWTGQEGNTQDLKAVLGLDTALDVDAAVNALSEFSTGAQNFTLADDQGHIAYTAPALVPARAFASASLPPWLPLPGDGTAEWGDSAACASATLTPVPATCWVASHSLPHGKDPASGFFVTANADPLGVSDDDDPLNDGPYLSFNWDDSTGFRATRITELLNQALTKNGSISPADVAAIQADHVSRPGKALSEYIAALPTEQNDPASLVAAKAILSQWATNGWDCPSGLLSSDPVKGALDARAGVAQNSAGCLFFHAFLRTLNANIFSDDLAVAGLAFDEIQGTKALFLLLLESDTPLGAAAATYCNDVDANGLVVASHTCAEQVQMALSAAYDALVADRGGSGAWIWGKTHTVQLISLSPFASASFSPGPFARPGGAFTVDVGTPALSGRGLDFGYGAGANVRHISVMDPDAPLTKMQLPGPERDVPYQSSDADLLSAYLGDRYFQFAFGEQSDAAAVSVQTFAPSL